VPIGDRVAIRGALHRTVRDGTWINIADGRDYSDRNSWAGRLSLRAQLTDDIETTFIYDRTSVHQHGTPIVFQAKGFDFNDPSSYPANGQVIPCRTAAALCGLHNLGVMLIPGFANYLASDAAHQASLGWGKFDSYLTAATSRLGRAPYEHILNWGGTNITTWDLSDNLTVKNIVGYRRLRSHHYQDIDGTSKGSSTTAGLGSVRAALLESTNIVDFEQVTEELQFQGSALDNRATWVAGTFMSRYFGVDGADAVQFGQRFMNPFYTTAKSLGVYGQVDVKFTDELTLTGGYRYSWDQRTGRYFPFQGISVFDNRIGLLGSYGHRVVLPAVTNPTAQCNFNRTATSTHAAFAGVDPRTCEVKASLNGSAPSYNITLQYRPSEEIMVYLAHRQGYRAGFLSARATSFEGMVNQDETVRDLELGVKSDFRVADMPVRLNAATYYSWYSNIAVSVPRIDPATGLPVNQAENSGAARFYGAEATLDVRPTEALTLGATLGLNRGIYDAFPAQTVNDALGAPLIFYANKKIKVAYPHETFTLAAAYTLPFDASIGEVTASANYYHAGKRPDFGGVSNGKGFSTLPAYGLLNARLDWKGAFGKPIDLAVFGSNLTDEHYLDSVFAFEDAAGFRSGFPGAPRTYGVSLTYRFGADAE
jgi:iron complex outermembrane receptor protein